MRFVIFTHSLVSDWNHGNAHFLRGVSTELIMRGHEVRIFEPADGWSLANLRAQEGDAPLREFEKFYPLLHPHFYAESSLDLSAALDQADCVLVHEWNSHSLVTRIGEYRAAHPGFRLFFHDTHHRSATAPDTMKDYDLRHYDGVLAYGAAIRDIYRRYGWAKQVWTWHEAADTRIFHPLPSESKTGDLVWIGNWGDDERTRELREFLIEPVKALGIKARVHGVRYPASALAELSAAGIEYCGWIPNYRVPEVFARHRVTVHIPRRPYVENLPGIPTIRPFEALACGIPLVSAPWSDSEHLFRLPMDFLFAQDGHQMTSLLRTILESPGLAQEMAANGLSTLRARHTCAHRAEELLEIVRAASEAATMQGAS